MPLSHGKSSEGDVGRVRVEVERGDRENGVVASSSPSAAGPSTPPASSAHSTPSFYPSTRAPLPPQSLLAPPPIPQFVGDSSASRASRSAAASSTTAASPAAFPAPLSRRQRLQQQQQRAGQQQEYLGWIRWEDPGDADSRDSAWRHNAGWQLSHSCRDTVGPGRPITEGLVRKLVYQILGPEYCPLLSSVFVSFPGGPLANRFADLEIVFHTNKIRHVFLNRWNAGDFPASQLEAVQRHNDFWVPKRKREGWWKRYPD
ncbi:hypothetical protein JCM10049v2_006776 [Rhodotorula toruloides]